MRRRFLLLATSACILAALLTMSVAMAQGSGSETPEQRLTRLRAVFPYELVRVEGASALQEWTRLKSAGRGLPVIIGGDDSLLFIAESFDPDSLARFPAPSIDAVLAKAKGLVHPDGLHEHKLAEGEKYMAFLRSKPELADEYKAYLEELREDGMVAGQDFEPPVGDWPSEAPEEVGLTVTLDFRTGGIHEFVYIVLVPTEDWTTIPAYLRWGGWNANPPPEFHVAALRSWRDRYGAELIGMNNDTLNLRVIRKPKTRDEALALAREQYAYCNDLVDQGVDTLSNLAAFLMVRDWWYFWWD